MQQTILLLLGVLVSVLGHSRFIQPPSRSSIWRVPYFAHLNPPVNTRDDALWCGNILQVDDPGSNCGVCGDHVRDPVPRANEIGGFYDRGIITATYTAGQVIKVAAEVTIPHFGTMEWRLCEDPERESQECFNEHLLEMADGSGTKLPAGGVGRYEAKLTLPEGVTCERCIIQWNHRSGNRVGDCGNGTSASGCGPQQTYRGCADISIL